MAFEKSRANSFTTDDIVSDLEESRTTYQSAMEDIVADIKEMTASFKRDGKLPPFSLPKKGEEGV